MHATPLGNDTRVIEGNPFRTVASSKFIEGSEVEETAEQKKIEVISNSSSKKSV